MAPANAALLSPAELAYIRDSLTLSPPVRPDGRSATQFRPLVAETDILPSANGSARVCFSDGTEAVVGVKVEVEKTAGAALGALKKDGEGLLGELRALDDEEGESAWEKLKGGKGRDAWVEIGIEVPGYRDDDALPIFLSQMLGEGLMAGGTLRDRLWINARFHWKLYIDVLLLSPPTSYPLPLLSMTTHLALLSARLPRLVSEGDEDPLFDDDWEASTYLYPFQPGSSSVRVDKPPVTLLVALVGDNILFDPSTEELAAAEGIIALSAGEVAPPTSKSAQAPDGGVMLDVQYSKPPVQLLSLRMIDPPSRVTPLGVSNPTDSAASDPTLRDGGTIDGVWSPPRGGIKRSMITRAVQSVVEPGGVGQEVMDGLESFARG